MKRFVSIALAALLVVVTLVGCGKSNPEGKYVIKSINGESVEDALKASMGQSGEGINLVDLLKAFGVTSLDEFMSIELKSDGVATMSIAMEDTETGTWKQEGNKILITTLPDKTVELTLKGKELSCQIEGDTYVFIKK